MSERQVTIRAEHVLSDGSWLMIDGKDISGYVQGFHVHARVGELTKIELELTAGVTLEGLGVVHACPPPPPAPPPWSDPGLYLFGKAEPSWLRRLWDRLFHA